MRGTCRIIFSRRKIIISVLLTALLVRVLFHGHGSFVRLNPENLDNADGNSSATVGDFVTTADNLAGTVGSDAQNLEDVLIVWSDYMAIPFVLEKKIQALASLNNNLNVTVFCGNHQCEEQIYALKIDNIKANRLLLRHLSKDTPLEKFVSHSIFYKHQLGERFLSYLHQVSVLLVLWNYGGLYLNLMYEIRLSLPSNFFVGEWIHNESMFIQSRFTKQSPFLSRIMTAISSRYLENMTTAMDNINSFVSQLRDDTIVTTNTNTKEKMEKYIRTPREDHFGILCYVGRDHNMGDEMQSWAALQFLPFLDICVDRHDWTVYPATGNNAAKKEKSTLGQPRVQNLTMLINGWYGWKMIGWPLPSYITPLMISMHIEPPFTSHLSTEKSLQFVNRYAPVGARDLFTLRALMDLAIDSYMSGCLTLLLTNPFPRHERGDEIIIVDVEKDALHSIVPAHILNSSISISHVVEVKLRSTSLMEHVYTLIKQYARAKLVITSRLHCAMPCVGLGIPVVFVHTDRLPGGHRNRLEGLLDLFHTVTAGGKGKKLQISGLSGFDWDRPQPNPNGGKAMRLRATLWHEVQKRPAFRATAVTFGIVPLGRPHTPIRDEMSFFLSSSSDSLTLLERRCIESVFYHHPFSKVYIYSNTLSQSHEQLFREVGYYVEVVSYALNTLLRQLVQGESADYFEPIKKYFFMAIESMPIDELHQKHIDLLPLLLLYLKGGVFLKPNVILSKSLSAFPNFITQLDNHESSTLINDTIMKFERRNTFIGECIKEYSHRYSEGVENENIGLSEIVRTTVRRNLDKVCFKQWVNMIDGAEIDTRECHVIVFGGDFVFLTNRANASQVCNQKIGASGWGEIDRHPVIVVDYATLPHRSKRGTLCHFIFNNFCVFCSDII